MSSGRHDKFKGEYNISMLQSLYFIPKRKYTKQGSIFVVVPCILISIKFINQKMHYLLNLIKF